MWWAIAALVLSGDSVRRQGAVAGGRRVDAAEIQHRPRAGGEMVRQGQHVRVLRVDGTVRGVSAPRRNAVAVRLDDARTRIRRVGDFGGGVYGVFEDPLDIFQFPRDRG